MMTQIQAIHLLTDLLEYHGNNRRAIQIALSNLRLGGFCIAIPLNAATVQLIEASEILLSQLAQEQHDREKEFATTFVDTPTYASEFFAAETEPDVVAPDAPFVFAGNYDDRHFDYIAYCYVRVLSWNEGLAKDILDHLLNSNRAADPHALRLMMYKKIGNLEHMLDMPPMSHGEAEKLLWELAVLSVHWCEYISRACLESLVSSETDTSIGLAKVVLKIANLETDEKTRDTLYWQFDRLYGDRYAGALSPAGLRNSLKWRTKQISEPQNLMPF